MAAPKPLPLQPLLDRGVKPLPVVLYPDPLLNERAREVTPEELRAGKAGEHNLKDLAERMCVTMYEEEGIGLAAPQVGVLLRLWLIDPSKEREGATVVFNPVLEDLAGSDEAEEGCLSIPDVRGSVKRALSLVVRGLDLKGEPVTFPAEDLAARVCQHETDHLDGILFIQHLGTASRLLLRRKLKALEEEYNFLNRRKK